MLIDTHLHLVNRMQIRYPWLAGAPALDRDWTYEAYEKAAKRLGITHALHMEVDVAPDDISVENGLIGDLMAQDGSLMCGAISAARPENEGFETFLEGLDLSLIKGIRRILHESANDLSQSALFRSNIALLGKHKLPFDLCVLARQLDVATQLVDACEGTPQ